MPSVNPRIAVYLPRDLAATVQRLAALRGVSRSAVIRDFLVDAQPVLSRVANLLDLAARSDRTALKEWALTLEAAQSSIERDALVSLATMDGVEAQQRQRLEAPGRARRRRAARTPGQ